MAHLELDKFVAERSQSEEQAQREPVQTTSVDDVMSVVTRLLSTLEGVVNARPPAVFPPQVTETISATRQVMQKVAAERDSASESTQRCGKREIEPTQVVGDGADGDEDMGQTGGAEQSVAKKPRSEGVLEQPVAHLDEATQCALPEERQADSVALQRPM